MADIGCGGCDSRWGGLLTSHCTGCHQTFSGLTAFDKHRTGSHAKGRFCLDPRTTVDENPESASFGKPIFKLSERAYPCWGLNTESPEFWKES